eukprot:6712035-Pyramimonas_sp.AAC.1
MRNMLRSSAQIDRDEVKLKERLPDWVKSADAKANWKTVKAETMPLNIPGDGDGESPKRREKGLMGK